MSPRKLAIAGSIAALSFAAVPVAQAATAPQHKPTIQTRSDQSRDRSGQRHADKERDASRDSNSTDTSRDLRER